MVLDVTETPFSVVFNLTSVNIVKKTVNRKVSPQSIIQRSANVLILYHVYDDGDSRLVIISFRA